MHNTNRDRLAATPAYRFLVFGLKHLAQDRCLRSWRAVLRRIYEQGMGSWHQDAECAMLRTAPSVCIYV